MYSRHAINTGTLGGDSIIEKRKSQCCATCKRYAEIVVLFLDKDQDPDPITCGVCKCMLDCDSVPEAMDPDEFEKLVGVNRDGSNYGPACVDFTTVCDRWE